MKKTDLIKEYVKLIIEAVRDPRFKESDLKRLKTSEDVLSYASKYLDALGYGSSRAAFLLSSKKVLKVAINKKGLAQNEAEIDIYTSPATRPITTKVFDYHPNYMWLISELVNPLKEDDLDGAFYYHFDVHFDEFVDALREAKENNWKFSRESWSYAFQPSEEFFTFFEGVIQTVKSGNLLIGDLITADHWGLTANGRIVLLDYGFTREVADVHYRKVEPSEEELTLTER